MTVQSKSAARPDSVTTGPIAGSRKIYTSPEGRPDIRVPFREIALDPSAREEPYRAYDTSGPYTDPAATIDLAAGLAAAPQRLDRRARLRRASPPRDVQPRGQRQHRRRAPAGAPCPGRAPGLRRARPASPSPSTNSPAPASSPRR